MSDDKTVDLSILLEWVNGNEAAAALCNDMLFIVHLWDDLIDKDRPRTDDEVNAAFHKAIVGIHLNPFFEAHRGMFLPLLLSASLQYQHANRMERSGHKGQAIFAYGMRNALLHMIGLCVHLTGGDEVNFYTTISTGNEEHFATFLKEFGHA